MSSFQRQSSLLLLRPDKWEVSRTNIILGEEIGDGFFGVVYKGKMTRNPHYDSLEGTVDSVVVAIKMLKREWAM